jgi:hypothetical protein
MQPKQTSQVEQRVNDLIDFLTQFIHVHVRRLSPKTEDWMMSRQQEPQARADLVAAFSRFLEWSEPEADAPATVPHPSTAGEGTHAAVLSSVNPGFIRWIAVRSSRAEAVDALMAWLVRDEQIRDNDNITYPDDRPDRAEFQAMFMKRGYSAIVPVGYFAQVVAVPE